MLFYFAPFNRTALTVYTNQPNNAYAFQKQNWDEDFRKEIFGLLNRREIVLLPTLLYKGVLNAWPLVEFQLQAKDANWQTHVIGCKITRRIDIHIIPIERNMGKGHNDES